MTCIILRLDLAKGFDDDPILIYKISGHFADIMRTNCGHFQNGLFSCLHGSSVENRSRILIEILQGIKEAAPSLHVTIKLNSSDFTFGGIKAHINEGYFVPFAKELAEKVSFPVIVVGGFRSLDVMEEVLNNTKIEFISLSRPLLCEPDLPNIWIQDKNHISKCVSCNGCYRSDSHRCIIRNRYQHLLTL